MTINYIIKKEAKEYLVVELLAKSTLIKRIVTFKLIVYSYIKYI